MLNKKKKNKKKKECEIRENVIYILLISDTNPYYIGKRYGDDFNFAQTYS